MGWGLVADVDDPLQNRFLSLKAGKCVEGIFFAELRSDLTFDENQQICLAETLLRIKRTSSLF